MNNRRLVIDFTPDGQLAAALARAEAAERERDDAMTATSGKRAIANASVNHLTAERAQRLIDVLLAAATDQANNGDAIVFDLRLYVFIETPDAAAVDAPQEPTP